MSQSRILQLAAIINKSVIAIHEILSANNLNSPSFDEYAPASFPEDISGARDAVLDATSELYDLLLEPLTLIYKHHGHNNSVCLQAIARFNIAGMIPPGGQIPFGEIAEKAGLNEQIAVRLLRHAMTMRIFCEPHPGMVAHTQASKTLANPIMNDWLRVGTEEMWPAAVAGFSLSNDTTESIYSIIGSSPERAVCFSNAMKVFATRPDYDPSFLIENYDWGALGKVQVVDIGGAQGHIATELARRFENLQIVVQDMDEVVRIAKHGVPEELKQRVCFMAHDFFSPQPIKADVFYLRWILHNWSDKYCILILRALISALKPGARIIIQEVCMPSPGSIPLWKERNLRAEDLNMGAIFNSLERTADLRFVIKSVIEPKGSALGIIEVLWCTLD
ncbi:S-adenosyl-L-methionine-dependent methyltransferase [Mollisia scopiformis]|uniref:S-adenosyl-L-methionine-dependent methyltransferase n=1 Tax=Mollisia scopiformis TaxID=149040 RepID=A0A194XEB1_MOLSC|nr:S-adenosyl-L-methionine-dependent methyltransferase [Mollisia scopiformis]KUJ18481.1 S-adenosyl-L-methionine-dependent methyltransferase [Mollisia scopiformis]